MPPHPLTNFKIQEYYKNEPKFNDVYSRNNSRKINDEICVINPDEYKSIENVTFFDIFGVEDIPREI